MLTMMLAAVAATGTASVPVLGGGDEASNLLLLRTALAAPERPRAPTDGVRYCFTDTITDTAVERRICRTRRDWRMLGLDPIAD